MKRSYLTFAFVAGVSHRLSVFSCYTVCYRGLLSSQSPDYRLSKITPITRSYSEAGKCKKRGQDIVIYRNIPILYFGKLFQSKISNLEKKKRKWPTDYGWLLGTYLS